MTFGQELVVSIQHLSCSIHFRCMLGGSSVMVWTKSIYFGLLRVKFIDDMLRSGKMGLAINGLNVGCSSFEFEHYLQACTTSGKQLLQNHKGRNPDEKSH